MKIWLLLFGFALANAATTIVKNNDREKSITIYRNSPEKYPTEFELGKTYRYNYTGDVRTSFPQTGNETIGQRINCTVEIVPLTTGFWNMRMVNTTVMEINGTHDRLEVMRNSTNATIELRKLAKHNITFQISQGKIEAVFTNKTEAEWITNIKKGILNMISLQLKKDKVYETDEEGVSGTCKTLYTIKETTNEDLVTILNVTKVRDLTNCTKTVFNNEKNFKVDVCDKCEKTEKSMDATATFTYNITGTRQRYIIDQVKSDAHYTFFPLGIKGGSIAAHINQTLKLFSVTENPLFNISKEQLEPRGGLMYKVPELVKVEEEMLNTVNKVHFMLKKLESQSLVNFTIDAPSHFILLVRSLTEADFNTLQDIWNLVRDKPLQRKWLIEALPYVNQEEMILLVKELITTEEHLLTTEEKVTLLLKIGTIRKPTVKSVELLKDVCEHRFLQWPHNKKVNTEYVYNITRVRYSCWRSLGVQINMLKDEHKYVSPSLVQSLTNCEKTFDKITKLTPWHETIYKTRTSAQQSTKVLGDYMTLEEAKALLETTKVTKVREMCLIAMGEAGLPDFITVIEPIIEQKFVKQTLDVRIAAVTALRKMKDMPNKVLSILLPVLRNPYEDSELRANAYLVITKTNQRPSVFTLIGQELNKEKSMQVKSFIYSHLKFLAENVEPCNTKLAMAARYALVFTKPVNMGPTYSKIRTVRTFNQETKVGTEMNIKTIFSEGELTPSYTNFDADIDMFGKKTKVIEVEVHTSGMTNLLEKMLGHDGFFYKRKSVFDLLKENTRKRRSVSTNEEELLKINKKVSPYEVTPEEPRLRLFISMFGNRITDLDINKDYLLTLIKEGKFKTDFSNLDEELAKKQVFNTTKGMMLMDQRYEHPTIMGLPLSYNTTVASIMRVTMNTTFTAVPSLISRQDSMAASVNITPEVVVNAFFKMGVHTPLIRFGSAINSTFNVTLPVQTNITIDFLKKKYELLIPQIEQNLTFLNFTHKIYNFWQSNQTENHTVVNTTLTNRKPVKNVMCMEPFQDHLLCMNMTFVPRLGHPTSPFHPLTGPSYLSIFNLRKPMAPKMIKLHYKVKNADEWEREKNIDIIMTLIGKNWHQVEYTNITTLNFLLNHGNKRIDITVRDTNRPRWTAQIVAVNKMGEEVDMEAKWGMPKMYTQMINHTEKELQREFFLKINSQNWTWNNTRNITMFWAELPQWLKNVTYITKTQVLPRILDVITQTTDVDILREPFWNPITNSTTLSLKVKENYTMDVELHMPLEKLTIVNVSTPINSSVLKETLPKAVSIIQRRVVEKYLSGNCTYNTTGNFRTYDNVTYNYNLTGSCPHVLTKDCSPNKRFTVLVQNTPTPSNMVRITPIVTVYIENNKIELLTKYNDEHEIVMKYNGVEEMKSHDSLAMDYDFGKIERNRTHFTVKALLGLTVVFCKDNVTTSISPWYVNKTCGLCGDFNGETFNEMKNTVREEQTNSTKFAASWLVHGDSCLDTTCKLEKEQLHSLPEAVYLENKPAACFSKEPVMVCPHGCNIERPENIFTGAVIPTRQFIKVGYFCMAAEKVEETKALMQARSELIKSQPVVLWRDIEVPHGCICAKQTCSKQ